MMSTKREERISQKVTDQQLLDSKVSEYHMYAIASVMVDWEELAPYLSLTESDQKEIKENFQHSYYLQKKEALFRWSLNSCQGSSYQTLIGIFHSQRLSGLADTIAKYPGSQEKPRNIQVLDILYWYLKGSYECLPHPSSEQWPSRLRALFPTSTQCYYDLILHEAPLNSLQEMVRTSSELKAVSLKNVLTSKGKLIVYFEGIAGSGKTTLSWHTCREWTEKRMLKQFDILIHVRVNDPHIQSTTSLWDIIPHHDKVFQKEVATSICSLKGKGVCFLLDGLDEASPSLLKFLLQDLITGKTGCPKLSFILTSRPDSRVTKRLESILTSRIVIAGFKGKEMNQFLDQTLGASSDQRKRLTEAFKINPRLEGLCSLPINAVIMSFVIHFIKDVPTTQTSLYKPLISNFLVRHIQTYLPNIIECHSIRNLVDDLPPEIQETFQKICLLAYSSVLENKYLFTTKEQGHTVANDILGFLEVHPRITMFGPERYYSFPHLSLQEFLAAIHLSNKSEPAQFPAIDEILNKNPRSQVLHFYAGLTGLSNNQALKLLSGALSRATDHVTIKKLLHPHDPRPWPSAKALAFLNCLYESQNETILSLPESNLLANVNVREGCHELQMQTKANPLPEDSPIGTLTLDFLPLTPIDCLSIGYYIRIKSLAKVPSVPNILHYYLGRCFLDHIGVHVLFTELKKDISQCTPGRVVLGLTGNTLHHVSLPLLKNLLQGQSNLDGLVLRNCFLPADLHCALKYLTEGLSKESSCTCIDLSENYLSTSHVHHLILMLRASPQLTCLSLNDQDLRRGMHLLWKAIQLLPNLQSLEMNSCNIHDPELALLQKVVKSHHKLYDLSIYDNHFTNRGLHSLLKVLVCNPTSLLIYLGLDPDIKLTVANEEILGEINKFRTAIGRANLIPKSFRNVSS